MSKALFVRVGTAEVTWGTA